jgi:hypothetical protein
MAQEMVDDFAPHRPVNTTLRQVAVRPLVKVSCCRGVAIPIWNTEREHAVSAVTVAPRTRLARVVHKC